MKKFKIIILFALSFQIISPIFCNINKKHKGCIEAGIAFLASANTIYNFRDLIKLLANRDTKIESYAKTLLPLTISPLIASSFAKQALIDLNYTENLSSRPPEKISLQKIERFTLDDLAGHIPEEVLQIIDFLKYPKKYKNLGLELPQGVLLSGPPGSGKTSIAKAIAGEVDAFFTVISSTEFLSPQIGWGANYIRTIFQNARKLIENNPDKQLVIFIDELDAIGTNRSESHQEIKNTLIELLNQLDGFYKNNSILVLAATTRISNLDPALIRAGRFDRIINLELPDKKSRKKILELYCDARFRGEEIDFENLTKLTEGFNAADLKNLINQARFLALRDQTFFLTNNHLLESLKIIKEIKNKINLPAKNNSLIKPITKTDENFTFKDLAGTIPTNVTEILHYLKNAKKYQDIGAYMPKGILLVGPPGTGKTSIARAIAGEIDADFFAISATEFVLKYVGEGSEKVRELFKEAREKTSLDPNKKAIIFIDEIDAIGMKRSEDSESGSREYRNTIGELLTQMDGFNQNSSIFVIAATNTPKSLDPALTRPGRFDRIVKIDLPDKENRKAIIELYLKKIKCGEEIDIDKLGNITKGFTGADLKSLVNESAFQAVREDSEAVMNSHIIAALNNMKESKKNIK